MKLKIRSLSYGGRGVGKVDGKTVFVKNGVPGDLVEIRIVKDNKSFAEAEIAKIAFPSENRTEPVCRYFEECGGCQWQNVEYETQLLQKENILRDSLDRIAGLENIPLEPIQPSEKIYGYRNKVVLNYWKEENNRHVGYNQENSHKKVSIDNCPVADDGVNRSITDIIDYLQNSGSKIADYGKVFITSGNSGSSVTFSGKDNNTDTLKQDNLNNYLKISSSCNESNEFDFKVLGFKFISVPSVFNQANYFINEKISEYISEFVKGIKPVSLLDLYCGIGNFCIPLSQFVNNVDGVDSDHRAIVFAKRNAKINGRENIHFHNQKVEKALKRPQKNCYDVVLLDPPRTGAKEILKDLIQIKPGFIIYVSCNPATLSRDIKVLVKAGYKILTVKPFDMFPQTYHIETVVILSYDTD